MKSWQANLSSYISKVFVRPNLPFVLAGGLEGHLWLFGKNGLVNEIEFPQKPELSHIEIIDNSGHILLAANNTLLLYNIVTGERQQMLVLDSKISCISYVASDEILYIGLWTNEQGKENLLAYRYQNMSISERLWGLATGDIVRSICELRDSQPSQLLVGSENKTVLHIDSTGNVLDIFQAQNRITKIRVYKKEEQIFILIISDAPDIDILQIVGNKLIFYKSIPLDARSENVFLYTTRNEYYLLVVTPFTISAYMQKSDGFVLIWQGDSSKAFIKSVYWWPESGCDKFIVERRDSSLVCYEFQDSKLPSMMEEIINSEASNTIAFLGKTLYTNERVYDFQYLPSKQALYAVTGDGQLLNASVDIKITIPILLNFQSVELLHRFSGDRLRTLAIFQDTTDTMIFLGGEQGVVYRYSTKNKSVSSATPLSGWIYDSALFTLKGVSCLLILCENGLYIIDKELNNLGSLLIPNEKLRCLHWDSVINRIYIGSETGVVYAVEPPITTLSGIKLEIQEYKVISRAQRKIRNISSVNAFNKRVIVIGAEDGFVYALDQTGNVLWSYLFGQWVRDFGVIRKNEIDEFIVVIGRQRYVDIIKTDSGKLTLRYELPYEPRTVRIFNYGRLTGMVIAEIASNLHLYTLRINKNKVRVVKPINLLERILTRISALLTVKNIVRFAIFIVGLIAFLSNLTQIIEFIIKIIDKVIKIIS